MAGTCARRRAARRRFFAGLGERPRDEVAERVASLAEGLEALGVRNVVLAGMPLTSSVPAVAQMCRAITGAACGAPQPQPVA